MRRSAVAAAAIFLPLAAAGNSGGVSNAAAVSSATAVERNGNDGPLKKVITLISELKDKLMDEGEAEAGTYDKFACFCKDTTTEKSAAITTGQNSKTQLEADLSAAMLDRDSKDTAVGDAETAIRTLRGELEALSAERHTSLLEYEKAEVDMTAALQGLEAAIDSLRAAKTATGAALLEVSLSEAQASGVRRALAMADALGLVGEKEAAAMALVQKRGKAAQKQRTGSSSRSLRADPPEVLEVPDSVYEFSSDDIVATLEDLRTKFRTKKEELDNQEVSDRGEYDGLVQTKENSIKTHEQTIETAKHEKALQIQRVVDLSKDLSTTSAQLLDDQQVLAQVTEKCNAKGVMWDQRTKARTDELSALASALQLVQDLDKADASTSAPPASLFLQLPAKSVAPTRPAAPPAAAAAAPPARHHTASLAAAASVASTASASSSTVSEAEERARLVSLFKSGAGKAHSAMLSALASQAAEDPFAKVKTLIQELIERLLAEAASEANHKGWCDKEVSSAEQKRDYAAQAMKKLNGELSLLEARRDQLGLWLEDLETELGEINETLDNATALREQEKTEHETAIDEAKEDKAQIAEAHSILDKYYKTAANEAAASPSFVQAKASQAPEAPDAGFDEAYGGAQGASAGILGMLELIMADHDDFVAATEKAEAEAAQEFLELETSLGKSKAEKMVAQGERQQALTDANAEDTQKRTSMESEQEKLTGAITELLALKPACFDSGMSAEERKAQREEEMEALKQALCILDQHGREGIEC